MLQNTVIIFELKQSKLLDIIPLNFTGVTINLLEDKFQESNKYYKRVTWCLKKCVDLQFDWIIMWEPHGM